jgi:hypothetical protein
MVGQAIGAKPRLMTLFSEVLAKSEVPYPLMSQSERDPTARGQVPTMATQRHLIAPVLTALTVLFSGTSAQAQSIIKRPGAHPDYVFEAEPHLVIRDHRGHAGAALGPGFRGTIVILDNGFIPKINNSVGIGFGLDWLVLGDDHCHGGRERDDLRRCHDPSAVVLPIVLQWNFWLHPKWSVFGEPGFALVFTDDYDDDFDDFDDDDDYFHIDPFVFYAGGRFLFSDSVALTMRLGFPASVSVGVSFLL